MKSYLQGNPPLKLALNEDLIIGKYNSNQVRSSVILDDCNFHECVNTNEFDLNKTMRILPPDGEFTVLNYRITGTLLLISLNYNYHIPFKVISKPRSESFLT